MNLFEKLLLARQISFTDGRIELLGQRVVISNANLFSEYTFRINDKPELVFDLYDSVKSSFAEDFAKGLGKEFGFAFKDFVKWMTDLSNMTGWGMFTWEYYDEAKKSWVITVEDSPISKKLNGKVNKPVDHIIRGFIAGGASAALRENMDVIEEECVALGAGKCRFILKRSDELLNSPNAYDQLGIGDGKVRKIR